MTPIPYRFDPDTKVDDLVEEFQNLEPGTETDRIHNIFTSYRSITYSI